MDAYDVARLIASQHPKAPKPRWGTVQSIAEKTLSVLPDGSTSPITVVRGCSPRVGGRVVMLVNGTEWIAVAQVGGDSVAPTQFQCGLVSVKITPNGQTIQRVVFREPFGVAPIVVVCLSGTISAAGSAVYKEVTVSSTDAAKNGFSVCLVSSHSTYNGSATVKWIAMRQ